MNFVSRAAISMFALFQIGAVLLNAIHLDYHSIISLAFQRRSRMYILLDVRYLSVFHANQTPVCLGPHRSVGWVSPDEHVKATDRSDTVLH